MSDLTKKGRYFLRGARGTLFRPKKIHMFVVHNQAQCHGFCSSSHHGSQGIGGEDSMENETVGYKKKD
jgi:hypothetical protein